MVGCGPRTPGEHWFFEIAIQKLLNIVGVWKGCPGVCYFAESVKFTGDHSEDRESTQDYCPILITKTKISAYQGSLKKVMKSNDQTILYPVMNW